jgi:hypothetical protein
VEVEVPAETRGVRRGEKLASRDRLVVNRISNEDVSGGTSEVLRKMKD